MQGKSRVQIALIPTSLESAVDQNNEVRLVDLFVDRLDLAQMDFRLDYGENGRPAYHPSDLLKLFI
jgi:transposase